MKEKEMFTKKHYTPWNKGKTGVYSKKTLNEMRKPKSLAHRKKLSIVKLEKSEKLAQERIKQFEYWIQTDKNKKMAFGEILGTIPSDAHFRIKDQRLFNYILAAKDKEFVENISSDFAQLDSKVKVHRRKSGLWYIEICGRWFEAFLPYLRRKNGGWIFSARVVDSKDKDFKAAVIRTFSDAEGAVTCTINDNKYYSRHISIYNSSKELLYQIKDMLSLLGILAHIELNRISRRTEIKGQKVTFPTVYSLLISNYKNLNLFHDLVGFGIPRKENRLKELIKSYKRIDRQYSVRDYKQVIVYYKKYKNCRKVSKLAGIPPQTVQNWALYGIKPRLIKIAEKEVAL